MPKATLRQARDRAVRAAKPFAKAPLARRDPLRFLEELVREQGDVARVPLGLRRELVVFVRPEHVQEVLVKQNSAFEGLRLARPLLDHGVLSVDGEEHLRQRAQLKPAFHHERLRGYAQLASATAARWSGSWAHGQQVDMAEDMMHLTLEVTGQAMFGPDHAREAAEVGAALTKCLEAFRRSPLAPWTSRLPTPTGARFRLARSRLDALVERILAERRALPQLRHDILAMLLEAEDPEGRTMSNKEARDQLLTLLVAGHETTALMLTWTWHHLAANPAAQERLHREVDQVLGGQLPTVDDAMRLPYTRAVLGEALRMHPPVWAIGRKALKAVDIQGEGINSRSIVVVSPYITQHDARWWPDPERFDPGRFEGDAAKQRHRFAYYPFGGGARSCIGEPLAWLEGALILTTLVQRWRVAPVPGAKPVERQPLLTMQPRGGLPLRVEARRS